MNYKKFQLNRVNIQMYRRTLVLFSLFLFVLISTLSIPVLSVEPLLTKQSSFLISQDDNISEIINQGKIFYQNGNFKESAIIWQKAADTYAQMGNKEGVSESLINKAEALQALGFYPKACNTLLQAFEITELDCQQLIQKHQMLQDQDNQAIKDRPEDFIINPLEKRPDSLAKTIGLRSLGDLLQKLGDLELSKIILQLSLKVSQKLPSASELSATMLSLGNTEFAQAISETELPSITNEQEYTPFTCIRTPTSYGKTKEHYQKAIAHYKQATAESGSPTTHIQAQLNQLTTLITLEQWLDAQKLWPQIQSQINSLPANRTIINAQINLAHNLICLRQLTNLDTPSQPEIAQLLVTSIQQAEKINDWKGKSYGLGYLGGLYSYKQFSSEYLNYAQTLTETALMLTLANSAPALSYQWLWQLGAIFEKQGKTNKAIAAYTQAFHTIESLRSNLISINTDIQFSFRDRIEPIYRELVSLLLQSKEPTQEHLELARYVIQSLEIAELENFLRCSLVDRKPKQLDEILKRESQTAAIYPIILNKRLEIILKLPNQPLLHRWSSLPEYKEVETTIDELSVDLKKRYDIEAILPLAEKVYDWLIRPLEADLSGINTLTFVLDSSLQKIPMAALYDSKNQKYLVEKYAIAVVPSSQILDLKVSKEKPFNKILIAGLTKEKNLVRKGQQFKFASLNNIKNEVRQIQKIIPNSQVLLDEDFKIENFKKQLNSSGYTVLHLATHAHFSSDPKLTFILTDSKEPLDIEQLRKILQSRSQKRPEEIVLMVLSACETAEGDKRATLGLAGVAVRFWSA